MMRESQPSEKKVAVKLDYATPKPRPQRWGCFSIIVGGVCGVVGAAASLGIVHLCVYMDWLRDDDMMELMAAAAGLVVGVGYGVWIVWFACYKGADADAATKSTRDEGAQSDDGNRSP